MASHSHATFTIAQALQAASDTRSLHIGPGALADGPRLFQEQFGDKSAIIVADNNTFAVAGNRLANGFESAGHRILKPFIFSSCDLYAEHSFVDQLEAELAKHSAIPIAVGAGTINDITKLAAHRAGRPYMCVATAASMDGYTAFGASITHQGSKQTFLCPAPVVVLADLEIISAAPGLMTASGYADLLAKITAGADWMLADAAGVEPIQAQSWAIIQGPLADLVSDPAGISARNPEAIRQLVEGLMLGGFAMQAAKSSRAASGAEHQFSHLWDMEHHTDDGAIPSHGFKVGIGTLAATALYEVLLEEGFDQIDPETCAQRWPDTCRWQERVRKWFSSEELARVALAETEAKQSTPQQLIAQLRDIRTAWPELAPRLRQQLLPFHKVKRMLELAGAPADPAQIGITRHRLRESFWKAYHIRRRFTVLDLVVRAGRMEACLEKIFGPQGPWPLDNSQQDQP